MKRIRFSLMSRGIKEKLVVAFCLMSLVPLLVLFYILANYTLPNTGFSWDLGVVITIVVGISILGFIVSRSFVLPVIKLAEDAKQIAAGQVDQKVQVRAEDEVGVLGNALNEITERVRENMAQLRVYGEETRHLHLEINRKIVTLSNLLQVSNLITQSAKVEEVVVFILEKLCQLEEAELNVFLEPSSEPDLFIVRLAMGANRHKAEKLVNSTLSFPWLQRLSTERKILLIDRNSGFSPEKISLQQAFGMSNAICQPLHTIGKSVGILICANNKPDFTFDDDMQDILKVFAKQMAIAIENDLLTKRAKKLEIMDELTGLYNARYAKNRLEEEIMRAKRYHRPCSLAVFNLDDFKRIPAAYGGAEADRMLAQVAELIRSELNEVDRAGRLGPNEFCVILPERNKRDAIRVAERIRQRIEQQVFKGTDQKIQERLTVSVGIGENPLDGSTAAELFAKATQLMRLAKEQGKNRVVHSEGGPLAAQG
ncbi:MAG: sensor domain-containing diguanylate cyclase [Candidatus Omnitrophica bacterium]|nr:sensor domain-containing diguanylate cyclase [Candidatus Omnitrophota bacterium]